MAFPQSIYHEHIEAKPDCASEHKLSERYVVCEIVGRLGDERPVGPALFMAHGTQAKHYDRCLTRLHNLMHDNPERAYCIGIPSEDGLSIREKFWGGRSRLAGDERMVFGGRFLEPVA